METYCASTPTTTQDNAAGSVPAKHFNVFISHRGPDTKKIFVDYLVQTFIGKGLSCFVDYRLQPGEPSWAAIASAIRNSDVQIVVLSNDFAASTWCLDEVYEVMQLKRKDKVLPVFFDVEPSEFRSQKALERLKAYSPSKDVGRWANALDELSRITGFRLDQANGFQGQLSQLVVSRVEELLPPPSLIHSPHDESQFNRKLQNVLQRLDLSAADVNLSLGITGEGKSIIAKLLFGELHSKFDVSCLLLGVRTRAAGFRQLEELQTKLVRDMFKDMGQVVDHLDQGLGLLKERLRSMRCLLIVDDVDLDEAQIKYLVVDKKYLGPGSRVIVTSRFQQVLTWAAVDRRVTLPSFFDSHHINTSSGPTADNVVSGASVDIIISYCSVDVHEGFINHMFESFSMQGLSVLVECWDLRTLYHIGSQPRLRIVVLSRGIRASTVCLDKLCNANTSSCHAMMVCIFYGLSQEEQCAEVFTESASHSTMTFFVDLGAAMSTKHALKNMVVDVVNLLNHETKQGVTDFPVGLGKRQRELEKTVMTGSEKTVGVFGMGGIGKTTLVKALYNNLHKRFEGSAFLSNVRATAKKGEKGLVALQNEIIRQSVAVANEPTIYDVQGGKMTLSKRLAGTNILLILDDIDNESQLDALYKSTRLGAGSRVIITSRSEDVLRLAEVDEKFEVGLLSSDEADMLFYWHAFLRPYVPRPELQDVVLKVVTACQGLPLSLEVLGALLFGHDHDISFWDGIILKVSQAQNKRIFDTLRISFDALEEQEQTAFLDVACFLIGRSSQTAVRLWRGCGWAGECHLEALKSRSLVKLDKYEQRIVMHDHLRDMGHAIVSEQSRAPHNRRYIWQHDVAVDVLKTSRSDPGGVPYPIRGLSWISEVPDHFDQYIDADAARHLSHLHILLLSQAHVEKDIFFKDGYLSKLRWLQWHRSNLDYLCPGFCLKRLAVLDLSSSEHLRGLWDAEEVMPQGLMELDLHNCKLLQELPRLEYLTELEWLDLHGCPRLTEIPEGIHRLRKLEFLDLRECAALICLPHGLTALPVLARLFLDGCKSLQSLPDSIGNLSGLRDISLADMSIAKLPDSFGRLVKLEVLVLNECSRLLELPPSIEDLRNLRTLKMERCSNIRSIPVQMGGLIKLVELHLCYCAQLQWLPETMGNLTSLRNLQLHHNPRLQRLPSSMGRMASLEALDVGHCALTNEGMPEQLSDLRSLTKLVACYNLFKCLPPCFTDLDKLVELGVDHCSALRSATAFPKNVRVLDMGDCGCLDTISGLEELKDLHKLVLCNCSSLVGLNGLPVLDKLKTLNVTGCSRLTSAPGLWTMKPLRKLYLSGSSLIPPVNHLVQLPSIEHVTVYGSQMPRLFRDCMKERIEDMEHADHTILSLRMPVSDIGFNHFAIAICLISHDQGWSDFTHEHGRYKSSMTFVDLVVAHQNGCFGGRQTLFRNRHADSRDQLHFFLLRPDKHAFVRDIQAEDTLEIRARSVYQAWRISVKQAGIVVLHHGTELRSLLKAMSKELRWEAFYSSVCPSLLLADYSMHGLAAMDLAGQVELMRLVSHSMAPQTIKMEKLEIVWKPYFWNETFGTACGNRWNLVFSPMRRLVWVPYSAFHHWRFGSLCSAHTQVELHGCIREVLLPTATFGKPYFSTITVVQTDPSSTEAKLLLPPQLHGILLSHMQTFVIARGRAVCRIVGSSSKLRLTPAGPGEVIDELYTLMSFVEDHGGLKGRESAIVTRFESGSVEWSDGSHVAAPFGGIHYTIFALPPSVERSTIDAERGVTEHHGGHLASAPDEERRFSENPGGLLDRCISFLACNLPICGCFR